jgi:hypothetical protein
MSYRIAISLAAAAIASCIATEAIAQTPAGLGGAAAKKQVQQLERGRKKAPAGFSGAAAKQVQQLDREKREKQQELDRELPARAAAGFGGAVAPQMQPAQAPAGSAGAAAPQMQQSRAPAGFAGAAAPQADATGGAYYAPASDNGNGTSCGRFPYPPCKKVGE